jgi:hypothetical protein
MSRRGILMVTLAAAMMAMFLPAGVADAQETEAVSVQVGPTAQVIAGGQALLVTVEVSCEPGLEMLEAHVSAQLGITFGQAGIGSVICDGRPRKYKVRINAPDERFSSGEAYVSAFVLLLDPQTGTTKQGQDAGIVSVVGSRPQ